MSLSSLYIRPIDKHGLLHNPISMSPLPSVLTLSHFPETCERLSAHRHVCVQYTAVGLEAAIVDHKKVTMSDKLCWQYNRGKTYDKSDIRTLKPQN